MGTPNRRKIVIGIVAVLVLAVLGCYGAIMLFPELGLALVRQAAIASGGDVQIVDSPVGACFEVSWPSLADTDQSEHKDARS